MAQKRCRCRRAWKNCGGEGQKRGVVRCKTTPRRGRPKSYTIVLLRSALSAAMAEKIANTNELVYTIAQEGKDKDFRR